MSFIINPYRYAAAGFDIVNSVIFNDDDSPTLTKTPGGAGNRRSMSFSFWLKRGNISEQMVIYNGAANDYIQFRSDDIFNIILSGTGGSADYRTTRKFRDTHGWYHFVIAFDTANATSTERMKLYVNGVQETEFGTYTALTQNSDLSFTNTVEQKWGNYQTSSGIYYDGYMAQVCLVDGSVLGPDSFGEFNSNGVWVPKDISATFGTTGYLLDFADSSALGNDVSGNNNDWTVNNITSTDQSTDTPTLNWCTLSEIMSEGGGTVTLSEGNLKVAGSEAVVWNNAGASFGGLSSGKWVWCTKPSTFGAGQCDPWVVNQDGWKHMQESDATTHYAYIDADGFEAAWDSSSVHLVLTNGGYRSISYTHGSDDMHLVAMDLDNSKLWFGYYDDSEDTTGWVGTGTSLDGDPANGTNPTFTLDTPPYYFGVATYTGRNGLVDFGQGTLLDQITIPTGFKKLNSDNITAPTVPDPTAGFQAITYEGTGANQTIVMGGNSYGHRLGSGDRSSLIIVSGTGGGVFQPINEELVNGSLGTTDGFGYSSYATDMEIRFQFPEAVNITEIIIHRQSAGSNVGDSWVFEATNDPSGSWTAISGAKDFSSTVVKDVLSMNLIGANDTYIYYRCRNTNGNGVNSVMWNEFDFRVKPTDNDRAVSTFQPDLVLIKNRDAADQWCWFDSVRGATKLISSNPTTAEATDADTLTAFTSTGFTLGADDKVNTAGERYVAYCFKAGGSASDNDTGSITASVSASTTYGISIAKFTGNGSAGATVGHGLTSQTPSVVITKNLEAGETMYMGHEAKGFTHGIYMSGTAAPYDIDIYFNDTSPTSSVVEFKTHAMSNDSGDDQIMYCFSNIDNFCQHSSYKGNGIADGPLVHLNFKPALVIIRNITGSGSWVCYDNVRSSFNEVDNQLLLESTAAETTGSEEIDFLNNGFKIRTSDSSVNTGGSEYLYMAWAAHPTWGGEDGSPATAV